MTGTTSSKKLGELIRRNNEAMRQWKEGCTVIVRPAYSWTGTRHDMVLSEIAIGSACHVKDYRWESEEATIGGC